MKKTLICLTLIMCLASFSLLLAIAEGDRELDLARQRGFVPDALWEHLSDIAVMKDLSQMLYTVIAETDEAAAEGFRADCGEAMTVNSELDRGFASLSLYYACVNLGLPEANWFVLPGEDNEPGWACNGAELNNVMGDRWEEMQHLLYLPENAGTFPRRQEGGEAWDAHWDDVEVAAYFSMLNRATFEGKLFFDYDWENNDLHMDYPVTNADAIRAVNRFFDMCHGGEAMAQVIRDKNAHSVHKGPMGDGNAIADIAIGTHFNVAATDWVRAYTEGIGHLGGYDNMYDHILGERVTRTSLEVLEKSVKAYGAAGFDVIRLPVT